VPQETRPGHQQGWEKMTRSFTAPSPPRPAGKKKQKLATHPAPSSLTATTGRGRRRSSTTRAEDQVLGPLFGDAGSKNANSTGSDHRSLRGSSSNSGQIQISARDLRSSPRKMPKTRYKDHKNLPKGT
jgi:hypothetical protein